MSILQSIILGIVQGLTEFLPISSTAHLRIVPALFHWKDPGTAFSAVIQLGTMFAVIVYFWKDLVKIYGAFIKECVLFCRGEVTSPLRSYDSKLAFWILLATIPICVFGYLFKGPIEGGMVRDLNIVSLHLIFFGIILFLTEIFAKQNRILTGVNIVDALLVGIAQCFALIPGVSRSGVTLSAGLLLGFKRSQAARFSFLLSVPAVLLSGIFELNTLISSVYILHENIVWSNLIIATLTASISGYFAIDFLLKYLQTHKTYVFVIYRILLGASVIYLSSKGFIY